MLSEKRFEDYKHWGNFFMDSLCHLILLQVLMFPNEPGQLYEMQVPSILFDAIAG